MDNIISSWLFQRTPFKKGIFFIIGDIILIILSLYFSFLLRLDYALDSIYQQMIVRILPMVLVLKITIFSLFRLYRMSWRFVSIQDLSRIIQAVGVSALFLMAVAYFFQFQPFLGVPRGVLIIDAVVTMLFISAFRISKRAVSELFRPTDGVNRKRTLILGAGNTGEMILRDIRKGGIQQYQVMGFLDDDQTLHGATIHGVRVLGALQEFSDIVTRNRITSIIIAIPALSNTRLLELFTQAKKLGIEETKIVPRIYDIQRPMIHVQELEDIKIEDLIGRKAVTIDVMQIEGVITDKIVLVTGAAGSIGSEIVRQVCHVKPRMVVLYDIGETELYHSEMRLRKEFPELIDRIHWVVGDVRDEDRVNAVFNRYRPDIVFHAAAYKHVPLMEYNAEEAVKVNILGTYTLAMAANQFGVDRFILISTDKAVRPTSIMGATKRMAEFVCQALNNASSRTQFISVRFGNVLGSRGSVLPLFLEQIENGGPVTLTHRDMKRYFMTIPEAVLLVLQASAIGKGGEVLVLDMGDPVKVLDLAEQLIRLHGLEPYKDIDIQVTGMRPGEKLFEDALSAEEGTCATHHNKIFIAKHSHQFSREEIPNIIHQLRQIVKQKDVGAREIRTLLQQYIQWYTVSPDAPVAPLLTLSSIIKHS